MTTEREKPEWEKRLDRIEAIQAENAKGMAELRVLVMENAKGIAELRVLVSATAEIVRGLGFVVAEQMGDQRLAPVDSADRTVSRRGPDPLTQTIEGAARGSQT